MIPIYKPYLPEHITKYAKDAIDSTWISSNGKYINLAIEKLKDFFGVNFIILTNNGTSSMHLVSKALQFKYPERNIILVPNNVYVACWNAFLYDKYYNINVVETDIDTWNFNIDTIEDGNIILCVHNLGNIINIDSLKNRYTRSIFVEDNCEGLFGKYNNKFSGTDTFCSACSFFGNKNITSGEGGAFFTNDEETYKEINKIHGQGQTNNKFIHDVIGYNYRMTNIQAAFIYGNMMNISEILERKQFVFDYYRRKFSDIENIKMQKISDGTNHANWMFGIRIIGRKTDNDYFIQKGIEIRPMFYPISFHSHLVKYSKNNESVAKTLSEECFIIPSYPDLIADDLDYIVENIKNFVIGK